MALSVHKPPMSWNRVLPKPAALNHAQFTDPFARPVISSAGTLGSETEASNASIGDSVHRGAIPCVAYHERPGLDSLTWHRHSNSTLSVSTVHQEDGQLNRKRTVSSLLEEPLQPTDQSPGSQSAVEESANQFCLCQAEPKIPRPRNAFILYRQHHQARVIAQNPGLANPEISKIIGEHWRSLSHKAKNEWNALAAEEKARHQQQYPDYRYQPRRNGRNGRNGQNASQSISDTGRLPAANSMGDCLKCGGRIMNPTQAPSTTASSFHPVMPAPRLESVPPPRRGYTGNEAHPSTGPAGPMLTSPPQARVRRYGEAFHSDPGVIYGPGRMPVSPVTPDSKRHRFNGNDIHVPTSSVAPPSYSYSPRRTSIPRADVTPPVRVIMAAPPRSYMRTGYPNTQPAATQKDLSLTLPPLKIQDRAQSQKGSIEAMIMSIPVLNKIKILSQIAPPLAAPGPTSPPHEVRGVVIAIDGLDIASVNCTLNYLAEELGKCPRFAVKIFFGPWERGIPKSDDPEEPRENFESFLNTISAWHKISNEICTFITTPPAVQASASSSNSTPIEPLNHTEPPAGPGPSTSENATIASPPTSAVSPLTIPPPTEALILESKFLSTNTPPPSESTSSSPSTPLPIALIPSYQLATVDASSIALPITDAYSPLDHWRWLATLWRGCVGADITVAIQGPEEDGDEARPTGAPGGLDFEGAGIFAGGQGAVGGGVEVRLADARAIVVRKDGEGSRVEEKSLRRLGFEIEEFLRR